MSSIMRGNVRMAFSGVRGAKWRSLLTMLGVIVGIVAVVTVVGIGEGVKRQVTNQLNHFGSDLITVRPSAGVQDNSLVAVGNTDLVFGLGSAAGLTAADVKTIQHVPEVKTVVPLGVVSGMVDGPEKNGAKTLVLATNSNLPTVLNHKMAAGGFWRQQDEASHVAVLGDHVAEALFDEAVPLGRTFTFHGENFVVRGVFEKFNSPPFSPTASFDDAIFIPQQAAAELTQNNGGLYAILAKPDTEKQMDRATVAITERLKKAHGGQQDFTALSPEQNAARGGGVVRLLSMWIWAVAAICLFIGGVGIMNIMLLSVTERMHEIGVRKAIGATSRQVLTQFLLEATVLSVVGGVIGIVLSLGVDGLLYAYTDLKPVISWTAIGVASGVSLAIGIVFGVAPAIKAARKDPIEALRHE